MQRILLTGMPGAGKSSVVGELVARGYKAVDTDDGWCHVVLLTAPLEVLAHRLDTRTTNAFGRTPEERRRFLDDVATVEPLLRRVADRTVETTAPLHDVVDTVLGFLDTSHART